MHFIPYDLETNGCSGSSFCDTRRQRIIQFAAQIVSENENDNENEKSGATFVSYVKPGRHIPAGSTHVHHITNEMVADAPPLEDVIRDFQAWVKTECGDDEICMVAHNGNAFDKPLLCRECETRGVPLPAQWQWLDTLPIARRLWAATADKTNAPAAPCSLGNLHLRLLGSALENAHDAGSDVAGLAAVLPHLLPHRQDSDQSTTTEWTCAPLTKLTDICGVGDYTAKALRSAFGLPGTSIEALVATCAGRSLAAIEGTIRGAGYYGIGTDDWVLNILSAATHTPVPVLTPHFPYVEEAFGTLDISRRDRQRLAARGVTTLDGIRQLFLYDAECDPAALRELLGFTDQLWHQTWHKLQANLAKFCPDLQSASDVVVAPDRNAATYEAKRQGRPAATRLA